MKILFDLLHPAHFHLFKNAVAELRQNGHHVEIIARQKDCLPQLLDSTGWPYTLIPRRGTAGLPTLALETLRAAGLAAWKGLRHKIDIMAGTSVSIGPAARLCGARACIFEEDDAAVIPLMVRFGYPFAHYIITPQWLTGENHGRKHLTYPGFHELAYLHPRRFQPDPDIRRELGVQENQWYFLMRLVALKAHHDIGQKGLSPDQARQILRVLAEHGRVFISAESDLAEDLKPYRLPIPPHRILDALAFADLLVSDSQTMSVEAAMLGTPSIRCNTFVGRLSVLNVLDRHYELTAGFLPSDFDKLLMLLTKWLHTPDLKVQWQIRRRRMLDECIDLTDWMLALFEDLAAGKDRRRPRQETAQ
ncbi:MAG TPA: DUF354 domain-containing protein [Anaerohalosphaeraceae bacterium]|nr:DUF354 domain-containing protein [Anaerohalosphaeraceae bacterium]